MPEIDLTSIDDAERNRLLASFKKTTAGKTIIYVEDHANMGFTTSKMLEMLAPGAQVHWVKKAEEGFKIIEDMAKADKDAAKKIIILTDDETHSSMTGKTLIDIVHSDKNPGMHTMPAVLMTGATVEDYHVGLNIITFMGKHAAVTGKPASIPLIARALEVLERNRNLDQPNSARPLTREEKKEAIYRDMTDDELQKTITHREGEYRELRERQNYEEKHGGHIRMRSDKKFWEAELHGNPVEVPVALDRVVERKQIEEKLETMGYARAELERREKERQAPKDGKEPEGR